MFTYAVPETLASSVGFGKRVLVPFGRSKTYVGIVAEVHDWKPEDYQVKDILQVLDAQPILLPEQYRLWQWIADYYMSPIGEVFKAALPAGLKAEEGYRPRTETYLRLTPTYRNVQALHIALDMLKRAPKQLKAFVDFLNETQQNQQTHSQPLPAGRGEDTSSADSTGLQGNASPPYREGLGVGL